MNIKCYQCYKPLGEMSFKKVHDSYTGDLANGKRGIFCNEKCYKKYLDKYFVETYKNDNIYWIFKNNKKYYIPYVGCWYCFDTIEGCRWKIDNPHLGII